MKPYQDLTYQGRLRRMRLLARLALREYGLQDVPFKLVVQAGNTLFRVYGPASPFAPGNDDLFESGQYMLRVHEPGYQEPEAIDLELTWLTAMRREAICRCQNLLQPWMDSGCSQLTRPAYQGHAIALSSAGSKAAQ
jgi:hypothetical protein